MSHSDFEKGSVHVTKDRKPPCHYHNDCKLITSHVTDSAEVDLKLIFEELAATNREATGEKESPKTNPSEED